MITNGVVSFEDGKKAAEEFAPARKVRVELHFDVAEGSDYSADLDKAALTAKSKVYELLGIAARVSDAAVSAKVAEKVALIDAPVAEKKKPGRKPKDPPPADDVDAIGGDAAPKVKNEIMEGLEDEPAQAVDLSDKGLYNTVVAINAKIKKPAEITAIVGKYCPNDGVPPSVRRIPEGKRTAFLKEIQAFAETFSKK